MNTSLKRITACSAVLAAGAVPAVALAHGGSDDHGSHGKHRGEIRGTVASFTDNVLTLKKPNGKLVAATVTSATELKCLPAASTRSHGGDDGPGDDHGKGKGGDDDTTTTTTTTTATTTTPTTSDDPAGHDQGDDRGNHAGNGVKSSTSCTTAALTPGAVIRKAESHQTKSGTRVWREVTVKAAA